MAQMGAVSREWSPSSYRYRAGNPDQLTLEARYEISRAQYFYGYKPYLDRLQLQPGQSCRASDNRVELDRARAALQLAADGEAVAMISGGDPGVFAMAAAVCEAIDSGPATWRNLELVFVPGVSAMLAVAARIGRRSELIFARSPCLTI